MNKVIIIGNLVQDPELKQLPSGTSLVSFSVAVNRRYVSNGETIEETSFVDVEGFGASAQNVSKFFKKGRPILVEGRLKQDIWESSEGKKRSKLKVILERFEFVDSPPSDSVAPKTSSQQSANTRQASAPTAEPDDSPF